MMNQLLILSASAGAGHTRAAQALEKAAREKKCAAEIRHEDALQYTLWWYRQIYSRGYLICIHHFPHLFGWLYRLTDPPWKYEMGRFLLDRIHAGALIRLIEQVQPDWVLSTHFLPPELVSQLKRKKRFRGRQAVIVTDMDVHGYWLCRNFDHYFVALEESRKYLEGLGIAPDQITVSGIPVDPVFAIPKDKQTLREKFGLEPNLPSILVSTGAHAVGPVEAMVHSLLSLKLPSQLIVICGHNQKLRNRLQNISAGLAQKSPVKLKAVGYTHEMDEYMTAADILVGKPGGLTAAEAMAKGLVFVMVNPVPGQEERNADHLLEAGAALRCHHLSSLGYKVGELLENPQRMAAMQVNAKKMARPDAAQEIIQKVLTI